jgi:hypothetical protein
MKIIGDLLDCGADVPVSPSQRRRFNDLGSNVPGQARLFGGNARQVGDAGGIVRAARDNDADHAAPDEEQVDAAM